MANFGAQYKNVHLHRFWALPSGTMHFFAVLTNALNPSKQNLRQQRMTKCHCSCKISFNGTGFRHLLLFFKSVGDPNEAHYGSRPTRRQGRKRGNAVTFPRAEHKALQREIFLFGTEKLPFGVS